MHTPLPPLAHASVRTSHLAAGASSSIDDDAPPPAVPHAPVDEPAAVRMAREYLEAHCTDVVRLEALAALTGLGAFHLIRLFGAVVGMPPYAYLMRCRVAYAARLLADGVSATAAACRAGFSDQSHLTRQFKRQLGVTPGQYARALRAGRPAGAGLLRDARRAAGGARAA